jgi:hypothetical protein
MAGIYVYRTLNEKYDMLIINDDSLDSTHDPVKPALGYILKSTIRTGLSQEKLSELEAKINPLLDIVNSGLVMRRMGDHRHLPRNTILSKKQKDHLIEEFFNNY